MLILAHIGIGKRIVRNWNRDLPLGWIVTGTLLPDLIDKPLYYGLSALTGRRGDELGLVNGTRTFGHSLLLVAAVGLFARKPPARALALGLLTHILLDVLGDVGNTGPSGALIAAFYPLLGWHFLPLPYYSISEHLFAKLNPLTLLGEVIGAALLIQDWRRAKGRKI